MHASPGNGVGGLDSGDAVEHHRVEEVPKT